MDKAIYLTQEGYAQYLESIKLAEQRLTEIRHQKGEQASELSDKWCDNSSFDIRLQEAMAITTLKELLKGKNNIVIVEEEHSSADIVDINSVVIIEFPADEYGDAERVELKLVATPVKDSEHELSINSPLGQAVYKKKLHDEVTYEVNHHALKAKIIEIK